MISFFVCLVVLIVGFFTYGKIAEKVFGSDDRTPPSPVSYTHLTLPTILLV